MNFDRELERARRLIDASYALHTSLDLDDLLGLILEAARDGVHADRGTVFLLDEKGNELWSRVLIGEETLTIHLPVGQGIAGTVAKTGEALRIAEARADPRFDPSWDERSGYRTREVLCVPIRNREGAVVGVFQLLNRRAGAFDAEDEAYLEALSVHAALALENAQLHASALEKERMTREVRLAQEVQRKLQPERRQATFGSLVVAGVNELCEDATGDYYDILVPGPRGHVCAVVGDATGHGLQAAIVMAEARAFLRAFGWNAPDLPRAIELANRFLCPDMEPGKFMTLFAAAIDPATGDMEWCNAGHDAPMLHRRATGEIERLGRSGPMLGVLEDAVFEAGPRTKLEPGDALLLFSDGVSEARREDGERYGEERLLVSFREHADREPRECIDAVRADVRRFTGARANEDDLTLVVVRREAR